MEISRNESALRQTFVETRTNSPCNIPHADPKQRPQDHDSCENTQGVEPGGLKPCRKNRERYISARGVPDAVIVGGDDMKRVPAWRQAAVIRFSSCTGFLPLLINTFQFAAKVDSLRDR